MCIIVFTGQIYTQTVVLNEVMASNGTTITDEDGDYEDWVELFNTSDVPIALGGYGLSDDYETPFRWTFPDSTIGPGEYILVWASGKDRGVPGEELHTNYSIDSDGEEVILTHPDGDRIDVLLPTSIPRDISFGRKPDGNNNWVYFKEPTPGEPNTTSAYQERLSPPEFSHTGGFYTSPFELILTTDYDGAVIYYTLDGSDPDPANTGGSTFPIQYDLNSELEERLYRTYDYPEPISIEDRSEDENDLSTIISSSNKFALPDGTVFKGTVVRAVVSRPGAITSDIITHSYFVNPDIRTKFRLPVVSLTTNAGNLFDYYSGLYVPGELYTGSWNTGNYFQRGDEWERPVHFEYYDGSRQLRISQQAGVRIHGGTSRQYANKSLRLYARNRYGDDEFRYVPFEEQPYFTSRRLKLRQSGQDIHHTYFRDALMSRLFKDTNVDYEDYLPAVLFFNGEFWGIINIRERFDQHYIERKYGYDAETVTILEATERDDHFNGVMNFVANNSMKDEANFSTLESLIDVESLIDLKIAEIFFGRWDLHNLKMWRANDAESRWRWLLYDMDVGMGLPNRWGPEWSYDGAVDADYLTRFLEDYNPHGFNTLFRSVMEHERTKTYFINRFADLMNTVLRSGNMIEKIGKYENRLHTSIEEHKKRWRPPTGFESVDEWHENIDILRNFAEDRPGYQTQHLADYFSLDEPYKLSVRIENDLCGIVTINSIPISRETIGASAEQSDVIWNGMYFPEVTVTMEAEPFDGCMFTGWNENGYHDPVIKLFGTGDTLITAQFVVDDDVPYSLMQPEAFTLSEGVYEFSYWSPEEPEWTYPPNMVFQQSSMNDPGLHDEMTDPYHIPFIDENDNEYHADDQDKFGYPYMLTGRTRINGLEENGISLINTGRGRDLGAVVLALDTRDTRDIKVSWTGGTVIPNSRVYHIRLQYRIGRGSDFIDVLYNGEPVEYIRRDIAGHAEEFGPVPLPEEIWDLEYIQLRWKYYYTGERLDPDIGRRDMLRLDNILIWGESFDDIPVVSRVLHNYPNPFNAETTIRYELSGLSQVKIEIFNSLGQRIDVIDEGVRDPGTHEVIWNAPRARVASGVYYCRTTVTGLEPDSNSFIETQTMVYVK